MSRRVVITGLAVSCCLGNNINEVTRNLNLNRIGLKKFRSSSNEVLRELYVGNLQKKGMHIQHYTDLEEIEKLSLDISKEALLDSQLNELYFKNNTDRISLSYGSSLAGIDHIMAGQQSAYSQGELLIYSRRFSYLLMNELKIKGRCFVDSSACTSGTAAIGIGYDLIKNNDSDIVLTGGVDNLSLFSLFGFSSLKNLSNEICKPFDKKRAGINLGAGASFFVLETLDSAIKRNAKIYGEIIGYGLYNDAYHITSPDPSGYAAKKAMNKSIEKKIIDKNSNIFINTHGTGTQINDSMEYNAIKDFTSKYKNVSFSSTKSRTGHCLGAAGSVELAISLIGFKQGIQYKTLNSSMDIINDSDLTLKYDNTINYVISNSFAFGGNSASIAISNFEGGH